MRTKNYVVFYLGLSLIVLFAVYLRSAAVVSGMPYFYSEDEAHHFNRTVNMVKKGEFNPEYFHKPSLHFYLRMPVVAASFLWNVRKGTIRKIDEIKTEDKFGIAGYSFTASHPGVVKWNRALSVVFSLGLIILAGLITLEITNSSILALSASLLTSLSSELINYSAVIGVDMPMSFFCLLATYLAIKLHRNFSVFSLIGLALVSGLALSTKYNSLPIILLPLFVVILSNKIKASNILIALFFPFIGFFLGSPYALVELPLFLNQFAYEIWHYGIAGHIGHTGEPGLSQAIFYLNWLASDLTWLTIILALIGLVVLLYKSYSSFILFAFFPIAFFLLMSFQKANFTRNLLVVIPYISVLSVLFFSLILETYCKDKSKKIKNMFLIFSFLPSIFIFYSAVHLYEDLINKDDSRNSAFEWINNHNKGSQIAVSGELWFPRFLNYQGGKLVHTRKGLNRINFNDSSVEDLYQDGYDFLVLNQNHKNLKRVKLFKGSKIDRIVNDPEINILKIEDSTKKNVYSTLNKPDLVIENNSFKCIDKTSEGYCWLSKRINLISVSNLALPKEISLEVMPLWKDQIITLRHQNWSESKKISTKLNNFHKITFTINPKDYNPSSNFYLELRYVKSPLSEGLNTDSRRLGIAVK